MSKMYKVISQTTGLLDLPNETLIYIFEFLSFEEVAKFRILCKRIDEICQKILNCGFQRAAQLHAATYKRIKSLLPRRESERRNHALARHADILTSVETRISMLSMTYTKYMDLNMCCFIPGRVLDEIFRILRLTTRTCIQLRPLEILQEFRDISSMAIEHFDEKIASEFKKTIERNTLAKAQDEGPSSSSCIHRRSYSATESLPGIIIGEPERGELLLVRKCVTPHILKHTALQTAENAKALKRGDRVAHKRKSVSTQQKSNMRTLQHQIKTLQRKTVQQKKNLAFFVRKVSSLTSQMSVMKRRLDELDSKNQELIGTIRQYNVEDPQGNAETTRTTGAPEKSTSKEETGEENRLEAPKETDKQKKSTVEPSVRDMPLPIFDNSAFHLKAVRKTIKRRLDDLLASSNEIEELTEIAEKRARM